MGSDVKQCVDDYPGSSLIINHHTRKEGAADFIDTLSGTFGVAGSADTIAILTRKRGELSGQIQITGRDVEEGTYALAGFPGWRLDGVSLAESASRAQATADREHLGDRSTQILNLVEAKGEMLTAEVALALGISSDTASAYLGRLARSGKIEKTGRGKWRAPDVGSVGNAGSPYVGSVGSVGNQDADQGTLVPPVGSVGSVGIPNNPTNQQGTRARAREASWWLRPDGAYDWAAMYAAAGV
jgi:DNA-binding CsgD family transcriptional regulator